MITQKDPIEITKKLGIRCIEAFPVIVLGSGASASHGISGMGALRDFLSEQVSATVDEDRAVWDQFKSSLSSGKGLEPALDEISLSESLFQEVVRQSRKLVLRDDQRLFERVASNEVSLGPSKLFRHLFNSTHKTISVVTTNYDRMAEYAADVANYSHFTGFRPGYWRPFSDNTSASQHPGHRTVEIWKVHGSVDWFLDIHGVPVALPDNEAYTESLKPLMVTPGLTKYEITHHEPFRSIIRNSDNALAGASSYLCVGYGFNDGHIQPKLVDKVVRQSVPIVILARTLTPSAKKLLSDIGQSQFLALEKSQEDTRAYFSQEPAGTILPNCALWNLEGFLDYLLGV